MLLVEGPRVARDAVDAGATVHEALYTGEAAGDPAVARVLEDLRRAGTELDEVSEAELNELADTVTPQGLLLVVGIPEASLAAVSPPRLAVLDAVQDPGNVGTLIRAADALGAGGVAVLAGTADPWSPKVVRAAAGASFRLPIVRATAEEVAAWCRDRGVPLLAAAADGDPAPRAAGARDAALVFGNEGAGVSAGTLRLADGVVAVPQRGPADSLNVAMAGAILMDRFFGG